MQGLANLNAQSREATQPSHSEGEEIGYLMKSTTLLSAPSQLASHRNGQRRLCGCSSSRRQAGRAPSRRGDEAVSCLPCAPRPRAPAPPSPTLTAVRPRAPALPRPRQYSPHPSALHLHPLPACAPGAFAHCPAPFALRTCAPPTGAPALGPQSLRPAAPRPATPRTCATQPRLLRPCSSSAFLFNLQSLTSELCQRLQRGGSCLNGACLPPKSSWMPPTACSWNRWQDWNFLRIQ